MYGNNKSDDECVERCILEANGKPLPLTCFLTQSEINDQEEGEIKNTEEE
jgi:hypothetical protein